jgi:hypothetical protein
LQAARSFFVMLANVLINVLVHKVINRVINIVVDNCAIGQNIFLADAFFLYNNRINEISFLFVQIHLITFVMRNHPSVAPAVRRPGCVRQRQRTLRRQRT